MSPFRLILTAMLLTILAYTAAAMAEGGVDFATPFLASVFSFTWEGQFNVDFLLLLWLGALWVAWRSGFTTAGIATALVGHVFGMIFFAGYLLWLDRKHGGDVRAVLLGVNAR